MLVRINKLLSQLGISSRRRADAMVEEGAVTLNGMVLRRPGVIVDTAKDRLVVQGREIDLGQPRRHLYFMVNKPKGYISTVRDTHRRQTVTELVPATRRLFPVGRLDKDSTGIILMTDDGELAHRLMHPKYGIAKVYEVKVQGCLGSEAISDIEKGVDIKEKRPSIGKVLKAKRLKGATEVLLKVHEGRKRQIRRTFEALGYKVIGLKRISYGGINLNIKEGSYRKLTDAELSCLRKKAGLA